MKNTFVLVFSLISFLVYSSNEITLYEGCNKIKIQDYTEVEPYEIDSCNNYFNDFFIDRTGKLTITQIFELYNNNKFTDAKSYSRIIASINHPELKKAGFKEGDKILKINNQNISEYIEITETIKKNTNEVINFSILRNDSLLSIEYKPPSQHIGFMPNNLHFVTSNDNIWLKLNFKNETFDKQKFLIEVNNANYIDAYFINNDSIISIKKSGKNLNYSQRDFPLQNRNLIVIPSSFSTSVFICIDKARNFEPLELSILSHNDTIRKDKTERFVNGLLFGIMLIWYWYLLIPL